LRVQGGEVQAWDVEEQLARGGDGGRRLYVTRFTRISDKLYVLLGSSRDYILVEGLYCSCPLFQRGLAEGRPSCHHIAGLKVAAEKGMIDVVDLDAASLRRVVLEILTAGFSVELRRILASRRED